MRVHVEVQIQDTVIAQRLWQVKLDISDAVGSTNVEKAQVNEDSGATSI